MKPRQFDFVRADSVDAAVAALADGGGEAKVIAGGQSLVPMLNFRLLGPGRLIDINGIAGIAGIAPDGEGLRIGALTRHHTTETSALVRERFPVLHAAMTHVAHLAIRNRGTFGGSLCHADPAAELPALCLLLDATLDIVGPNGARNLPARDFLQGALSTALADDEILTGVCLPPLPAAAGWEFAEVARRHGDFAITGVAATVTADGNAIGGVRLVLFGVGETALRVPAVETLLAGHRPDEDLLAAAAEAARDAIDPMTDLHGSADYRRHLAAVLTRRVLTAAWARAGGKTP